MGKREKKFLKLLEYIIESNSETFSLKSLAKLLNQDIRVLITTIHDSNNLGGLEYGLKLEIVKETLVVSIKPTFSISHLKQQLLRKSLLFILCDSLLKKTFTNLLNFSIDNFISISTMYRQVKLLKKVLYEYKLTLDLSNEDYFFGSEKQIRHFYFELYFSAYGYSEEYGQGEPRNMSIINQSVNMNLKDVPFPLLQKIKLFTFISLTRNEYDYFLTEDLKMFNIYDVQLSSVQLKNFYQSVWSESGISKDDQLKNRESAYFLVYLLTIDIISISKFEMINIKRINQNDDHYILADQWISEFCHFFQVEIPANVYFFFYINLYYFFTRMELISHSSIYNIESKQIYEELKKENRYILNQTLKFVESLSKNSFPRALVATSFYFMLIRDILFSLKQVRVCVFSSLSHSQKMNIEMKVKGHSLVPVSFAEKITDEVDLVISDYYFEDDKPMLFTSVFPKEREFEQIGKELLEIYDSIIFAP